MSEDHEIVGVRQVKSHQFTSFLVVVSLITVFFIFVALSLYQNSGTMQLDLSRPGYDAARKQVAPTESFEGFGATGEINDTTLKEFQKLFDEKSKDVTTVDAFSPTAISDKALQLED